MTNRDTTYIVFVHAWKFRDTRFQETPYKANERYFVVQLSALHG
jgi:hypothetical protein